MNELLELIIVDDEERVLQALEREIRLEFGTTTFTIKCFANPAESIIYIRENEKRIFLVISDLRMPEINGSVLLEQVRSDCPDIQTILLTAYTDMSSIQKAVSSSIQSLLFKPWTKESLISEVYKALKIWLLKKENRLLNSQIDQMLRSVGEFQQTLFSHDIPDSDVVSFSVYFKPFEAFHCGGDFYEILYAGEGRYMIILGDVAGHGPKSAMITGMLKSTLQMTIAMDEELLTKPDLLLAILNERFFHMFESAPDTLISLSALFLDTDACTLAIASAGIPSAIHIREGKSDFLRTPDPILGTNAETLFQKTERFLLPGDKIILFTDGLVNHNPYLSYLSPKVILDSVAYLQNYSADTIKNKFLKLLPGEVFTDDVTIVALEILSDKKP